MPDCSLKHFRQLPDKERFSIVCCQGNDDALEPEFVELAQGCDVKLISLSDHELNVAYSGAVSLVYPSSMRVLVCPYWRRWRLVVR